jgi:hypothetical protein
LPDHVALEEAMKTFAVALAVLALIAAPAHAQMGGGKRHRGEDSKAEPKKPQVDDKAYKAALERIPEPKGKYDPWGVARPNEGSKKSK